MIAAVNPASGRVGGLSDGYLTAQSGPPTGTPGSAPPFRGVTNVPGSNIGAPQILSSAARNNRGSNVQIPYARVCPASEIANVGRIEHGDMVFVSKYRISMMSEVGANQVRQVTTSVSTPHSNIMRVVGVDYMNRHMAGVFLKPGQTFLAGSSNPMDEWRSLTFLQEWTLDGIVLSNDSPGVVVSAGSRNDQVFNVAIQGPSQVNNGFEDDSGNGLDATAGFYHDGKNAALRAITSTSKKGYGDAMTRALVGGPFYHQYPLQMFDRKIKPMCDIFLGLVCRRIEGPELDDMISTFPNIMEGLSGKPKWIHVFQFIPFSDRQVWQHSRDAEFIDDSSSGMMTSLESERASQRRGPLYEDRDPNTLKSKRNADYMPRKRPNHAPFDDLTYLGIKDEEIENMVGAWRIGKVMDTKSARKDYHGNGPIDTGFRMTVNVNISFMDWRALRRSLTCGYVGSAVSGVASNDPMYDSWTFRATTNTFDEDDGRVMFWPSAYYVAGKRATAEQIKIVTVANTPIDPTTDVQSKDPATRYKLVRSVEEQYIAYYKYLTDYTAADTDPAKLQEDMEREAFDGDAPGFFGFERRAPGTASVHQVQVQSATEPASDAVPVAAPVPVADPVPAAESAAAESAAVPAPVSARSLMQAAEKAKAPAPAPTPAPAPAPAPSPAPAPAPTPEAIEAVAPLSLSDPPPPKRKTGEDVLSGIFGSSSSAPSGSSGARQPDDAARSFPRRSKDR